MSEKKGNKAMPTIGMVKCDNCQVEIPLKQMSNGLAMYSCQFCDFKVQTFSDDSDRRLRARSRLTTPAPAPAVDPTKEEKPAVDSRPAYLRK